MFTARNIGVAVGTALLLILTDSLDLQRRLVGLCSWIEAGEFTSKFVSRKSAISSAMVRC